MPLADLAVHVDHRPERSQAMDLAIELAAQSGSHLAGIFFDPVPVSPELLAMSTAPTLLESIYAENDERLATAREAFLERVERAGVRGEFRRGEGPMHQALAEHARVADLMVVTQESDGESGPILGGLADSVVMASGRPVLVVPFTGAPVPVGGTALVAWNGGRESARAANDALPLLSLAREVQVVVIDPEGTDLEGTALPGAALAEHLARHDIPVETKVLHGAEVDAGNVLLSHAADVGANLIVSGAYGHSRLRETVLGGMTRHLMLHMTAPVLMSH